jgi:hypothetical protein
VPEQDWMRVRVIRVRIIFFIVVPGVGFFGY